MSTSTHIKIREISQNKFYRINITRWLKINEAQITMGKKNVWRAFYMLSHRVYVNKKKMLFEISNIRTFETRIKSKNDF